MLIQQTAHFFLLTFAVAAAVGVAFAATLVVAPMLILVAAGECAQNAFSHALSRLRHAGQA